LKLTLLLDCDNVFSLLLLFDLFILLRRLVLLLILSSLSIKLWFVSKFERFVVSWLRVDEGVVEFQL
jgi:hypothetical protein